MRSSFDTLEHSRRRSFQSLQAQYRRGSKVPFIYPDSSKLTKTTTSCSSTPIRLCRGTSFDSASPLLTLKTPNPAHPSKEMLEQIKKYRTEAEIYANPKGELSPLSNLIRTYTERRGKYDMEEESEFSTPPRRRHSIESYPRGTPPVDMSERYFGK